jgi:5-methylcytosine-specific restriction endonuclease McrA
MHDQSTTPFDRRAHCAKVGERTRFQPGKVESIRERDGHRCQGCGRASVETVLTTHHMIPWEVTHDDSPENLTTLCRSCHTAVDAALARIDDWPAVLAWIKQEV